MKWIGGVSVINPLAVDLWDPFSSPPACGMEERWWELLGYLGPGAAAGVICMVSALGNWGHQGLERPKNLSNFINQPILLLESGYNKVLMAEGFEIELKWGFWITCGLQLPDASLSHCGTGILWLYIIKALSEMGLTQRKMAKMSSTVMNFLFFIDQNPILDFGIAIATCYF